MVMESARVYSGEQVREGCRRWEMCQTLVDNIFLLWVMVFR